MPIHFSKQERDERLSNQFIKERGGKWVVIKHSDGSVISTHDSKEKAEASFKAMMMHKGSDHSAAGLNAEVSPYPPQAEVPQPQTAPVYNPAMNADLEGEDEHGAVAQALQRAQQQGATPEQAREQAMQTKNTVQQRALNGQETSNYYQLAKVDDVNKNPVGDILRSEFDGFVPQTAVTAAAKSLQ